MTPSLSPRTASRLQSLTLPQKLPLFPNTPAYNACLSRPLRCWINFHRLFVLCDLPPSGPRVPRSVSFLLLDDPVSNRLLLVDCAQGCLANATSSVCQPGEVHCLCLDQQFINSTTTCFQNNCNGTDLQSADQTAQKNCALAVCFFISLTFLDRTKLLMDVMQGVTLGTPSATAGQTASTDATKKSNGADSTMINIVGGAAALGLAALAL